MNRLKPYFSPDVQLYMELNGFTKIGTTVFPDHMQFIKNGIAVIFSKEKIIKTVASDSGPNIEPKTYIGFDGKNVFDLMVILNVMGAISLRDVQQATWNEMELNKMHSHFSTI